MEENKNKVTMSVITIVIIAVVALLIIGTLVTVIIVNNIKKPNLKNPTNEIVNDNKEESNTNNTDTDKIDNADATNDKKEENKPTENTDNSNKANSDVNPKSSTRENPLALGEWGISSKYVSGDYKTVPVSVTKVTRGASAEQAVKDFCNRKGSIYKYEDPKEGMEWAVVDYKVDLSSVMTDSGVSVRVDSSIKGAGSSASNKYNNMIYIIITKDMSSTDYTKNNASSSSFLVQLPKGYTDYVIAMGATDHEIAYFKGK